ncbi:6-hydroxymethylpterin diphosphokinase MptE-like protein [Brevibacillus gelatini]|uniref:motility associated factor glycosyltransferase family protein n=1 Tax=Brevibacillus gelatini TaxID=1655277 RepID=UPI003D81332A
MLIENVQVLKKFYPDILDVMKHGDESESQDTRIEEAKNQLWTMAVLKDTGWNYLHSKYNPIQEAERFVQSMEDVGERHVLFYGVGLGYHIDLFREKYPDATFSVYEPNLATFYHFLEKKDLNEWSPKRILKKIMVEREPADCKKNLSDFTNLLREEIYLAIFPSYQRIFEEETKRFFATFKEVVYEARQLMQTNRLFAKRTAINGFKNIPHIIDTPSILEGNQGAFHGKPAILVAAGPSLNDEIARLRQIKKNGSAYIFSVGSALNSLLSNGIMPDATFSYDGSVMNKKVFAKVLREGISQIPLVFGSTIGFETLQEYPGKMVNFFVKSDYVMRLFLKRSDQEGSDYIDSFMSIATLTLQLLAKLGFSPIILVGQNFAFRAEEFYAAGIEYINPIAGEKRKANAVEVKDVYGGTVQSSRLHTNMRKEMEGVIESFKNMDIINSTKGGAHIEGTVFLPLERVMEERLHQSNIVESDWLDKHAKLIRYDYDHLKRFSREMLQSSTELAKLLNRFQDLIEEMKQLVRTKNRKQLEIQFQKFDKLFDKLQKNKFNLYLIQTINNVSFKLIMKMLDEVRLLPDPVRKADRVSKEFGNYLEICSEDTALLTALLEEMCMKVLGQEILS